MEIWTNTASSKHFILIYEHEDGTAHFVTPDSKIKRLNINLFDYFGEMDKQEAVTKGLVNAEQIECLEQYENNKFANLEESLEYDLEQMQPHEYKRLLNRLEQIGSHDLVELVKSKKEELKLDL